MLILRILHKYNINRICTKKVRDTQNNTTNNPRFGGPRALTSQKQKALEDLMQQPKVAPAEIIVAAAEEDPEITRAGPQRIIVFYIVLYFRDILQCCYYNINNFHIYNHKTKTVELL